MEAELAELMLAADVLTCALLAELDKTALLLDAAIAELAAFPPPQAEITVRMAITIRLVMDFFNGNSLCFLFSGSAIVICFLTEQSI
jgi:hypothetical protein